MKIARCGLPFAGALACLLVGCEKSGVEPCAPSIDAGRIQGFVRTGDVPVDATVRATRAPAAPGNVAMVEARVGRDGSYLMDVPAGRYVVGLRFDTRSSLAYEYSAAGIRCGDAPPDTLLVDPRHSPTVDFDLASMRVHLDLSPRIDGATGTVNLHRRGAGSASAGSCNYIRSQSATIAGGALDVALSGVLPGAYRVEAIVERRVRPGDYYFDRERFWMPGVRDSGDSPWIELPADRTAEIAGSVVAEAARLQGRIRGAWLDFGLQPPSVALFTPDSTIVLDARPTGSDGSFDVEMYVPGPVKLRVRQESIDQWLGGATFETATVLQLEPGQTISGIEVVESGLWLSVQAPVFELEMATFRLYDAVTSALAAAWHMDYDADLIVPVPNLRPGTYRMQIEPSSRGRVPWAPQWYDRAANPAEAATIAIGREGEIARVSVILERGGTIAGVVRETEGVTADYSIYITSARDPAIWGYVFAWRSDPQFLVQGLPDGDWKVGAWRRISFSYPEQAPEGTVWYPGTTDWQAAGVIPIRGFQDVTGIEIVMPGGAR
jgi:hypothetical protein